MSERGISSIWQLQSVVRFSGESIGWACIDIPYPTSPYEPIEMHRTAPGHAQSKGGCNMRLFSEPLCFSKSNQVLLMTANCYYSDWIATSRAQIEAKQRCENSSLRGCTVTWIQILCCPHQKGAERHPEKIGKIIHLSVLALHILLHCIFMDCFL